MKNTVTNISETKVKITVEVDQESWKASQEKAFKKVSANVVVKGFRPGKAPRQLLAEHTDPAKVFDAAVDDILNPAFIQALAETKVEPFLRPQVNITKLSNDELTIEYTVVTAPKVTLGEYKGIEAVKEAPSVTDEEIDNAIANRLKNNASLVLKDGPAEKGDTVVFDFLGKTEKDGEMVAFEGGAADNYSLELGSNQFVPGFEDALIGVKAGDKKNVDITFPEQYVEELAGKKAVFECKIHEVKAKEIPELNDEAVADLTLKDGDKDIKTVDELKDFEKRNILQRKLSNAENKYYNDIVDQIVEKATIAIDEDIVLQEAKANLENLKKQIEQNGMTYEQYLQITGSDDASVLKTFQEQAEKNIKGFVVLQEIAKAEKLTVSDEDLDKEAEKMSAQYGIKKEDVLKYMKQDENRWKGQLLDQKLHDFLVKESKVKASAK